MHPHVQKILLPASLGFSLAAFTACTSDVQITDIEVSAFVRNYETYFNNCDAQALGSLMSSRFSGFGARGGLAVGRDIDDLERQCEAGYKFALSFEIKHVDNNGQQPIIAALAKGSIKTSDGRDVPVNLRFSFVLAKENTRIVLVHSHISSRAQ
jgi:ketosteroid isomerase-like protein